MSTAKRSIKRSISPGITPDNQSGVRHAIPGRPANDDAGKIDGIRLIEVLPYVSDEVLRAVDKAIEAARNQLGIAISENGQLIMFPGLTDEELEIPAAKAADFAGILKKELAPLNIAVSRTANQITLARGSSDDPGEEQGHPKK